MGELIPLPPRPAPERLPVESRPGSDVARMVTERCGGDTDAAIRELTDVRACLEQMRLREMEERILGPRGNDGGPTAA